MSKAQQKFDIPELDSNELTIEREWAMPNKWTFDIEPIGEFVREAIEDSDGLWIDPFAGNCRLADVTNDFDPEQDTDYTLKAKDFFKEFDEGEVDGGVIVDPPYSPRQVKEHYNSVGLEPSQFETGAGFMSTVRDEVERVSRPGAKALTFGWNSTGIGKTRDFVKDHILLVCHGGSKHDTICVREKYE